MNNSDFNNILIKLFTRNNRPVFVLPLLLILFPLQNGFAQIVDDSTKQIYGPRTVSFVLEKDFITNNYVRKDSDTAWSNMSAPYIIDTSINNLHNYNYIIQDPYIYQNLGNFLSPMHSIYYRQPEEIGKTYGFTAFDPFALNPGILKYYDTKSPYTSAYYVQGSKGQQKLELEHSRNISYRWNAGLTIQRMTSKKVVGAIGASNSLPGRKLESIVTGFAAYTRYYTKNERYQLLANFTHQHVIYYDFGGIVNPDRNNFEYEEEPVNLFGARTIDKRVNYHLYHEFSINKKNEFNFFMSLIMQKGQTVLMINW